jgi:hypothetical protein
VVIIDGHMKDLSTISTVCKAISTLSTAASGYWTGSTRSCRPNFKTRKTSMPSRSFTSVARSLLSRK